MAKLTIKELEALRPEQVGQKVRDADGLIGIVRPKGESVSVKFSWRYRFDGKVREASIGTWPKTSLTDIRNQRDQLRAEINKGDSRKDVVAERKAEQEAERLRKQAEHEAELLRIEADRLTAIAMHQTRMAEVEAIKARMTVKQLFDRWEKLELKKRKDKGAEARRAFEKDVFPTLGDVAAEDIKRSMIAACLDKVVERGSPIVARNLLGDLRQMFGFAIKREYAENDPTSHLKRDDFGKKTERDRVLNDDEVKQLTGLLSNAGLQDASIAAVWIMLSSCCRVGEISRAKWANIDLKTGKWRIPPDDAKNAKEHTVYLSAFAIEQFKVLKNLAVDEGGKLSAWVLPASNNDGHVCVKSLAKQIGDRQRGNAKPLKNRTKLTSALILQRGKWTPHDLRRTGATLMGRLGVRPDVIEKCLNHVEQNALVRIYQRQSLEIEQAEAWRLLGERLELLTNNEAANVIPLRGNAA